MICFKFLVLTFRFRCIMQVVCLIELPSYFITNVLMETIGRKKTLFLGMIGSGIFCIVSELVPGDLMKTIAFVIGKMLITISFSCLYIFTIEIFPTNLRHRFFSICSVVGRIGSILTPLTPILAQNISPRLPLIIFSGLSLSSALLLCTLPETLNRKLPDSVQEALS
jgi:MFS family permease